MIQTILFDYGGTLDTAARHWSYVIHEGYTHAGLELTQEQFREAYVYAERALAKFRYIQPKDDFYTLLHKKVTLEVDYLIGHGMWQPANLNERAALVDAVALYCNQYAYAQVQKSEKVLSALAAKYKLVMVSNFYGNLTSVLQTYGIAHYFDDIVESAVVGVRKPNPEIYALGVKAAGSQAHECVVVGDSYGKDIVPATQVGCETVWFKGEEWEPIEVDESLPTHVITSLDELLKYY